MQATINQPPFGLREVLYGLLQVFNPDYQSYLAVALLFFIILLVFSFFPDKSKITKNNFAYFTAIFCCIIAFKWPDFFRPELNPDESYCLAIASKLFEDPIYWKSAVGATHGPLLHYPLMLPYFFGFAPDYAFLRVAAILTFSITFFFAFKAFDIFFGKIIARSAVFPFVVAFSLSSSWDFAAYNGEHVTTLLLSICLYLTARVCRDKEEVLGKSAFKLGFWLGLVPYSKIQGIPIAITLTLAAIFVLYQRLDKLKKAMLFSFYFLAGCLLPTMSVIVLLVTFGGFKEFLISYIFHNFTYGLRVQASIFEKARAYFANLYAAHVEMPELINSQAIILAVGVVFLYLNRRKVSKAQWAVISFALLIIIAGILCVVTPGNLFSHYSLFLFLPLTVFYAAVMGVSIKITAQPKMKIGLFTAFVTFAFIFPTIRIISNTERQFVSPEEIKPSISGSNIAKILRGITSYREPLAIWGWAERLYQEANLYPATRYPSIYLQQQVNPFQQHFVGQFVSDFVESKAPVFIDAIGKGRFGADDRLVHGHETIPGLLEEVSKNYFLLVDIENLRIYLRNERWKLIKARLNKAPQVLDAAEFALNTVYSSALPEFKSQIGSRRLKKQYFSQVVYVMAKLRSLKILPDTEHDAVLAMALANFNEMPG